MKKYGYLYERLTSMENLRLAYINASRGKHGRQEIIDFAADLENNLLTMREALIKHTYRVSPYKVFKKYEPKERIISKLPVKDRVVQWAIMQVVEPIWVSTLTSDTYSCLKGRGIHACLHRLQHDLSHDPEGTEYCLKFDIRKFYPSIDHAILKTVVRRKLKDPDLLWLLDVIIDSVPEGEGIPIGNYLSQFFANLYLSELDHMAKERMFLRYYYRYADDVVILAPDKDALIGVLITINQYMAEYRNLSLKSNYQIFPVDSRGIDFLGYVCFHTHTLMRKSIKKNMCRAVAKYDRLREEGRLTDKQYKQAVCSWLGWAKHCNSKNLLRVLDMAKFSEVAKVSGGLTGTKVRLEDIFGKHIKITAFQVTPSRFHDQCITIQFMMEEQVKQQNGEEKTEWVQHIVFTGSEKIIKQLDGLEIDSSDPVDAKIVKQELSGGRCFYSIVDP